MAQIGITPEMHAMAVELSILGREAERVCTGFSTPAAMQRLYDMLGPGKGKASKLRRAIRDHLASEAAAEKERARLASAAKYKPGARPAAMAVTA